MAERDPFGRRLDENPLAGLGSLSDGTHSQAAEPVVVEARDDWAGAEPGARQAAPVAAEAKPAVKAKPTMSASSSSPPPRSGNPMVDQSLAEVIRQAEAMSGMKVAHSVKVVSRVVKLVVFLIVIGVIASVAKPLVDVGKDVRDAVGEIPSTDEIAVPGTGSDGEQAVPTGLSSNSMLTRRNLDRVVKRLSTSGLGRMRTLTIRPDRVDAQLLTKGGSLRSVQVRYDEPDINAFGTSGAGFSHLETIAFAKIDTGAAARLARSAAGRARLPVSRVDYVTLNSSQNKAVWGAYLKGGKIFLANSRGKITRRIS